MGNKHLTLRPSPILDSTKQYAGFDHVLPKSGVGIFAEMLDSTIYYNIRRGIPRKCLFPTWPTRTTFSYFDVAVVVVVLLDHGASLATPHSDKRRSYSRVMSATVGTRAPLSVWKRGAGANEADWRL